MSFLIYWIIAGFALAFTLHALGLSPGQPKNALIRTISVISASILVYPAHVITSLAALLLVLAYNRTGLSIVVQQFFYEAFVEPFKLVLGEINGR